MTLPAEAHPFESTILEYLKGLPANRAAVEQHLDTCDECRALVAELAQTSLVVLSQGTRSESSALSFGDAETNEVVAKNALPNPGQLLADRFLLGRVLGQGAMGIVYEATDKKLGSSLAIKVFWPTLVQDSRVEDSIRRETLLGRRIQHPNVRSVYDVGSSNGYTYLTMELATGTTLEACLRDGALPEAQAVDILDQVCRALSAAHAAGVVHRDLKPSNIAVEPSGRVIVMDFGLARDVNAEQSRYRGRGLVGTPAYWAPEQARGEPATPTSDIYSLGLIAYRLFSGRHFTLGEQTVLPPKFRDLIGRAIETFPRKRHQSAESFRRALHQAASGHPRRRTVLLGAVLTVLVLAGVGVGVSARAARLDSLHVTASSPPSTVAREKPAPSDPIAEPLADVALPPASTPVMDVSELPAAAVSPDTKQRAAARPAATNPTKTKYPPKSATVPEPTEERPLSTPPVRPKRPIDREDPYAKGPR